MSLLISSLSEHHCELKCHLHLCLTTIVLSGSCGCYITVMVAPGGKLVSPDVWIWSTPSFGLPQDEHRNAEKGQVKEHYMDNLTMIKNLRCLIAF